MSSSPCVPGPIIVPFTQPDPPRAEPIQAAVNILVAGFEKHRDSIDCTNDRIDTLIAGGASLLMSLNGGSRFGPRPNINLIEGVNVTIQLTEDAPGDEFDVTIAVPGLSSAVTNGANVGSGPSAVGFVFRDKTGTTLNFRTLAPLSPLLGLTLGDLVLIAVVTNPSGAAEVVGTSRVINGTSPIRINGGASSTLASDITVSYRFNQRTKMEFWEDFIGLQVSTGVVICQNGWTIGSAGLGTSALPAEANHPGILRARKYATGNGIVVGQGLWLICQDSANNENVLLQGGLDVELCFRISWVTEFGINGNSIVMRAGLGDQIGAADFQNGVYFEYDPVTSANWLRCTAAGGARTKTDTGVAVTGSFTSFRFQVNAGATSIEFFINGTSVGSNAANIPTAAGQEISPEFQLSIAVSAAVASQNIQFDADDFWMENASISR